MLQCDQGASAPVSCQKYERERKETEKRPQKAAQDQQRRATRTQKHLKEVAKIQEDIDRVTQSMKDKRLDDEQDNALAQMKKDLAAAKALASRTMAESSLPGPSATGSESINNSAQPAPTSTSSHQSTSPLGHAVRNRKKALQDHLNTCLVH
jgi:hypothetical protein